MNRNLLKWILIAVVILGAAAYLMLSETPSGKKESSPKSKKEQKEQIAVGHSMPFRIEPVEGITISAAEDALDKDREFKLTPVDDKTYDHVVKKVAQNDVKPLLVLDLDAGLKPDQYFPGDYDVEVDLDKMGIPRSLQDRVRVYRMAGSDKDEACVRYVSRVSNGKLCFKSNQNSYIVIGLCIYGFYKLSARAVRTVFEFTSSAKKWVRTYYTQEPTTLSVPIEDESGDFILVFRFKDTENPDGYEAFMKNEEAFFKRRDELEIVAKQKYKSLVQKKMDAANVTFWDDFLSTKQAKAIRESISVEDILQDTLQKDPEIQRLQAAPEAQLPQSILTVKDQVIRANQYLNSIGLHHLNFELPIYLVNDEVLTEKTAGAAKQNFGSGTAFVLFNYTLPRITGKATGWEKTLCTLVHELCHVRQQCYYAYIMMNGAPAEGSVVVLERDAAKLWYKNQIIKSDPEDRLVLNDILTERVDHYIFGYPLDNIPKLGSEGASRAYTLGDAIESIRKGSGKEKITMEPFMSSYSMYGPHFKGWTGWIKKSLDIDDDQLRKGWVYFGERHLQPIYDSQSTAADEAKTVNYTIEPTSPVIQMKRLSKPIDYAVNTFKFTVPQDEDENTVIMPNVFVYRKGDVDPYVTFYWSDYKFEEYNKKSRGSMYLLRAEPSIFYTGNRATDFYINGDGHKIKNKNKKFNEYYLAAVSTTPTLGPKPDYYVVALFPPEQLTLRKVKEDKITFVVPKPERKLTKEKLITGAVITYKDKNGNEVTRDVKAKDFGRKATWSITGCTKPGNRFSLSMHWYYQADSQTVYESPESEPVTWGAKDNNPEEEVKPTKEPKTNYWKQVNVRMNKSNTSFKESQNSDEEVSPDYRSIDFVVDKSEKSCDFSGMAATEETSPDGKTRYVSELYMTGTLTYTEPPVFWIPTQQYKARWDIADDPYFMKIKEPFVFEAKNASSNQAACTQSKKDKIDTGHSTTGKVNWLRSASTTFEARHPEKDGPKFFTLSQTYSIKEREGSNLMATVTFEYDYEWIGEPEEEEKEEETTPEGGHWKLVKIETDDSHKHFKAEDVYGDKNRTTATISGGSGNYSMHVDWWGAITNGKQFTGQNGFIYKINRQFHGGTPKQYYTPGKNFNLSWVSEELQAESLVNEMIFNAKNFDHYPVGSLSLLGYDSYLLRKNNNRIACDAKRTPDRMEMNLGVVPAKEAYPRGFVICEVVVLDYPSAAAPGCYINNYYIYEWVEGEPEEETAPEGGCWRLVKTEADDAHMTFTDQNGSKYVISGGAGQYHLHMDIAGEIYEKGSDGYYHEVGKGVIHTIDRDYAFETPKQYYREKETGPAMSESEETTTEITNGAGHNSTPYIWGSGGFRLEKLDFETTFPKKLAAINHYEYDMRKKGHEWSSNFSIPNHDMFYPDGFKIIQRVIISENCYFQKVYIYEWVSPKTEK